MARHKVHFGQSWCASWHFSGSTLIYNTVTLTLIPVQLRVPVLRNLLALHSGRNKELKETLILNQTATFFILLCFTSLVCAVQCPTMAYRPKGYSGKSSDLSWITILFFCCLNLESSRLLSYLMPCCAIAFHAVLCSTISCWAEM